MDYLTLELTRRGVVEVARAEKDEHQCGPRGGRTFHYTVKIVAGEDALDRRGFIVDQRDVHQTVQAICEVFDDLPSCEELAIMAARTLLGGCPRVRSVSVDIGTGEGRGMCATITRGGCHA